jgi:hypothetical protein
MTDDVERWEILTSDDPEKVLGEVTFTRREPSETEGAATYRPVAPDGQPWVDVVEEFVTGPSLVMVLGGKILSGPHDRDAKRLGLALAKIVEHFPVLRIRHHEPGAPPRLIEPVRPDPFVEATREIAVREIAKAFEALPPDASAPIEAATKELIRAVMRAEGADAIGRVLVDAIDVAKKEPALADVLESVMSSFSAMIWDASIPIERAPLEAFSLAFTRWRVGAEEEAPPTPPA